MTPGMRELVRYMAYIAVKEYIEEIRIEKARAQNEVCDRKEDIDLSPKDTRGEQ
jgi:hypothetical protein